MAFAHEGECEGFEESAGCEVVAYRIEDSFAYCASGGGDGEGCICGDMFIAVYAGDFFDEIDFAGEVGAPAGGAECGGFWGVADGFESKLLEDAEAVFGGDMDAEEFVDAFEAELNGVAEWRELGAGDDGAVEECTAGDLEDEFAAASGGPVKIPAIGATFEAVGGGAVEFECACGSADGH